MKSTIVVVIILSIIISGLIIGVPGAIFQQTLPTFVQYTGTNKAGLVPDGQPLEAWQQQLIFSEAPVQIGNYKISVEKSNQMQTTECKPKTCEGTESKDQYGCSVWSYTLPDDYWCTSTAGCACYTQFGQRTGIIGYNGRLGYNPVNCYPFEGTSEFRKGGITACGGTDVKTQLACGYSYKIYKDDVVIKEQQLLLPTGSSYSDESIGINFMTRSVNRNYDCYFVQNEYVIKPTEPIIEIVTDKSSYIQGDVAKVTVKIKNTWLPYNATVSVNVCQPTIFGESCDKFEKSGYIPINTAVVVDFDIPTATITGAFKFKPSIDIKAVPSLFPITNVNYNNVPITSYSEIKLGTYIGDYVNVLVSPKPIYIEKDCRTSSCDVGYICKQLQSGSYGCLRTDIIEKTLTCQITGCPANTENTFYACLSNGVCAEQVFLYKDIQCQTGMTKIVNSDATSYCLRTEIVKEVSQCTTASDCQIPCSGVSVGCSNNLCDYRGSCDQDFVGCKAIPSLCAEDEKCDTSRLPQGVCTKTTMITLPYVPVYIWAIFIILGLMVGYLVISRRR